MTTPSAVHPGDLPQLLRDAGLRVTRPRVAVLGAVHAHPHSDTDSLIAAARRDVPDVSHQTVYDCLHALTRSGLRAPHPAARLGGALRVPRRRQPPPRGVPRRAARSPTSTAPSGPPRASTPSDDHGFTIDEAEVVYRGPVPHLRQPHGAPAT